MDKNLIAVITTAVLIMSGILLFVGYNNGSKPDLSGIILFYGDGCPHCKIVDDFIAENKIEEKVKFSRLEVFNNTAGAKVLRDRAQACGISANQIGVPFLWTGQTCIVGDQEAIKFFKEKAK